MICQKKNKRLLAYCLSLLLFCLAVTPCLLSVPSYASETSTQTVEQYFREHNFYETCAFVCRKYASFPYTDYLTGASSGIIYDNFADYLETKGKSNLLQEDVIITGTGGGRGYDIPQDVRQEMLNFVQEIYIDNNTPTYVEAYIPSYNNMNPNMFVNANGYFNLKNFVKNCGGLCFIRRNNSYTDFRDCDIVVVPRIDNFDFIGSLDSNGYFSNVGFYYRWVQYNLSNLKNISSDVKQYRMDVNGNITASDATFTNWNKVTNSYNFNVANSLNVFSNYDKNELIYLFPSLQALKNYNSYNAQPYYMPSNSQTTVPYYDGFTQGDLNQAGNFYNNIVINTEGSSPNDIRKKTDSILGSIDGLFGDDQESSSAGLFDSLGDIITGATGAISPIKEIVLGDIKELVADVFDFLPPTIITLWVSGIIFGIFFGVLKLIRG